MKTLVLAALLLAAAPLAGSHPHFNDGGALAWSEKLADAQKAAAKSGKLIFVEYGRKAWGNCRALVEGVLPAEKVRSRIAALAVGLAADCDKPESDVQKIMSENLKGAGTLPFVGFLTPDLKWVAGFSGGKNEAGFIAILDEVDKSPLLDATDAVKKKLVALADKAAKAAEKADWKAVIAAGHEGAATTGRSPDRVRLDDLVKKAHEWADAELARIVDEVRKGGDLPAARKSLGDVKKQVAGEPEAADIDTGLKALSKLATIRSVEAEPKGVDPAAMREKAAKEFETSRWKAVFEAAPPPETPAPPK